jgi:predicted N-acyltransferase
MYNLIKVAKKYGLIMVENLNFLKFYEKYLNKSRFQKGKKVREYRRLLYRMGMKLEKGESISQDLWDISYLYKVVVFQKVTGKKSKDVIRKFDY